MPLLDLKTDLKSLKYGQDRPGGGNSGQPYIQNNINNPKDILGFDDGLVRGGAVGAARASFKDTIRIGKWLKDFSKGPLWIVKQVGLQRSNPKLETLSGAGGFFGEPTRLYNLGLNTLAQVPVGAFGIHFNRHGLAPVPIPGFDDSYLKIAQANNKDYGANNRLVKLKSQLISSTTSAPQSFVTKLLSKASTFLNNSLGLKLPTPGLTIYDYSGGPGSVYGLGRTLIKRYDNTTTGDTNKIPTLDTRGSQNIIENYKYSTPISNEYGISMDATSLDQTVIPYINNIPAGYNGNSSFSPTFRKYSELKDIVDKQTTDPSNSKAILTYNDAKDKENYKYNSNTAFYTNNKIKYNNGVTTVDLGKSWVEYNREKRVGSGTKDQINLTPILDLPAGSIIDTQNGFNINDLVKFRIQALNGDKPSKAQWMIFRAYITQFSDTVDAKWNSVQYLGRGEEFYTYTGFTRKVQIGFKVAALSAEEMKPMYQKLNFLMGNLMPDYSNGLMRGPMMKMTIGNWFDGQDGILNSLSYTIPNDAPWEIGLPVNGGIEPLILPHIVEVSMTFTPIGSQTKGENQISKKSVATSHIAQNYNNETQYIDGTDPASPPPPSNPDTSNRANTASTNASPVANGGTKILSDGTRIAAQPFTKGAGPVAPTRSSFSTNPFTTSLGF